MLEFKRLLESNDREGAMRCVDEAFDADPLSTPAIFSFASLMTESNHPGPALFILRTLAEKNPKSAPAWQNLSRAYSDFDMHDEALNAILRAHELKPESPEIIAGVGNAYARSQDWPNAMKWANKRLKMGDDVQSHVDMGFANLCTGNYGEGWDHYNRGSGFQYGRAKHDYGLPEWDGSPGKVIFYKEQGLGDQIAFLSCLPEAINDGLVGCVAVHEKLTQLYRDNFDVRVCTDSDYDVDITGCTHQAPMSVLPQIYRRESFPGEPYLKPNPDKAIQWQALLDTLPGKKIGIAWNGGVRHGVGFRHRSMDLDDFAPLFDMDATFINLEYKPADTGDHPVKTYPWCTLSNDYSDTAALVSCLDAVVCVPTTVYHLAGALGVPAYVLTPEKPHFHEFLPWWGSVDFYPKTTSMDSIQEVLNESLYRSGRAPTSGVHSSAIEHRPSRDKARFDHAFTPFSATYHAAGAD